jgi:hypothetical protein
MRNTEGFNAWRFLVELEAMLTARGQTQPHEESEQHRLFCDEHYCIERGPLGGD